MIRLNSDRTQEAQLNYHRHCRAYTLFCETTQAPRIHIARKYIESILKSTEGKQGIVELGCGAGEITGPYSNGTVDVTGVEIIAECADPVGKHYPNMKLLIGPVEELEPIPCTILVLCEFLEHVHDPEALVKKWLPHAQYAIIGHPLDEPNPPYEKGHCWSYSWDDYKKWAEWGGHEIRHVQIFPCPPVYTMIYGLTKRLTS